MAETPARYCGNCGHELSPEDQFCQNCGTPVHQAATVPTPGADVPVPPPPQAGGAGGGGVAAPGQPAQRGWGRRHPILTGCLGIIGLLFFLSFIGAVIGGGGGGGNAGGGGSGESAKKEEPPAAEDKKEEAKEKPLAEKQEEEPQEEEPQEEEPQAEKQPKPKPEYSVGQTAQVANVTWKVSDAYLTNLLKSNFGTQKQGRFVVVDFTFTNNRNEEVTLDPELHMVLKDSKGREFGTDPDAYEFMPVDLDIFLKPVNPGVSTNGRVIYQVAADANGFTLKLDDVELMEDKSAVFDLSNIPLQEYDSASASATATASPGQ